MPDRKVSYILDVDYEGNATLQRARTDLRETGEAGRAAAGGVGETSSGLHGLAGASAAGALALGAVSVAFAGAARAAGAAYDAIGRGAELEDTREDFEALAESVGMSSSALLEGIETASGGLLTAAQGMASASELINLNLGLTQDQITALVGSAAELGVSLEDVTNVINTQSTRGLAALGLGIDNVQARVKELTDTGMGLEQAFATATIEAMADKIAVVGTTSETAAGKMLQLEASGQELKDTFSELAFTLFEAAGGVEAVARGATSVSILSDALAMMEEFEDAGFDTSKLKFDIFAGNWEAAGDELDGLNQKLAVHQVNMDYANVTWDAYAFAVRNGMVVTESMAQETAAADVVMLGYGQRIREAQMSMEAYGYTSYTAALAQQEVANVDLSALNAQIALQDVAAQSAAEWAEHTRELTSAGGANFTTYAQQVDEAAGEVKSLDEVLYETAQNHAAPIDFLSDFGVDAGIISEQGAAVGEQMAQQIQIAESLAQAVERGVLAWQDYPAAVQEALAQLNGVQEPRPVVDVAERGYRAGWEENFEAPARKVEPIPIDVQMRTDAIATAVEEAQGIVEGFISPEEAYEAVMTLNIEDVVTKGGQVETLIAQLPSRKTITIDVRTVGREFLQELLAAGVIQ